MGEENGRLRQPGVNLFRPDGRGEDVVYSEICPKGGVEAKGADPLLRIVGGKGAEQFSYPLSGVRGLKPVGGE